MIGTGVLSGSQKRSKLRKSDSVLYELKGEGSGITHYKVYRQIHPMIRDWPTGF